MAGIQESEDSKFCEESDPLLPTNGETMVLPCPTLRCGPNSPVLNVLTSGAFSRRTSGLGVLMASFYLVAQLAGLGVLALPWAFAQTGWSGIFMLVFTCIMFSYAGARLGKCWVVLEDRWPEYQTACRQPFAAIAYRSLGNTGRHFTSAIVMTILCGVAVIITIITAQLLSVTIGIFWQNLTVCSWIVVSGIAFVPLSWFGSPKDFWFGSVIAMLAVVAVCVVVTVKLALQVGTNPSVDYAQPTITSIFFGFGTIMFSYGGSVTFPTIQNDMSDRTKFSRSVVISFAVLFLLYLPVGVLGYMVYGSGVAQNILVQVSGITVIVVSVLMMINNVFTFILVINAISQCFEDTFKVHNEFGVVRCLLRTVTVAIFVLIALTVPNFGKLLGIIGAVCTPLTALILPSLFYLRLSNDKTDEKWPSRRLCLVEKSFLYFVITVGFITCGVASYFAFVDLFNPSNINSSCFLNPVKADEVSFPNMTESNTTFVNTQPVSFDVTTIYPL